MELVGCDDDDDGNVPEVGCVAYMYVDEGLSEDPPGIRWELDGVL